MVQVEEKRLAELLREEWMLKIVEEEIDGEWFHDSLIWKGKGPEMKWRVPGLHDIENISDKEIIKKYL